MSLTPAPGATEVSTDTEVQVVFDVEIRESSLNAGSFHLRDLATDGVVGSALAYDAEDRTATLRPDVPLATGRTYEVVLEPSIKSKRFGIGLRDGRRSWQFTTSTIAASGLHDISVEWELQLLRVQLASRVAGSLGASCCENADLDLLMLNALDLAEEYVWVRNDRPNADLAAAIALALIGEDAVLDLLDAGDRLARELPAIDWAKVPERWHRPLGEQIGEFAVVRPQALARHRSATEPPSPASREVRRGVRAGRAARQ